ncbi:hypothetical protein JCM11641_006281 [Rhodosporidiobolus odoratus]
MNDIVLHPPDSNHADISSQSVPYDRLMGRWCVIASTLPLWRNKRDVTITYSAIPGEPATTFDDSVEFSYSLPMLGWRKSEVKGVDRLEEDVEGNGARWKWRGKGLLKISTSQWQLLGHSLGPPSASDPSSSGSADPSSSLGNPDWVVTYFSSTLFTPAGLDIYARTPDALSQEHVEKLVDRLKGLGGEIEELVKDGGMFRVPFSS